jgi:nitrilase
MSVVEPGTQRVAVVQAAPVAFDIGRTLEKTADLLADASRMGAKLALFPEAFISAYPRGLGFGAVVGSRTAAGREQFRVYWESAIEVPGPEVERLSEMARAGRAHLVIGVTERDGGTLYCTVLFFGPDGRYLGKHRKLMPTASERLIWGFGDGSTLPVFDTELGQVGAVICWENYMPLLRTAMYAKGVQIYIARRPQTGATPGYRRCATSPRRAAVSSSPATSLLSAQTIRQTMRPSSATTPKRWCRAAEAASLGEILAGPNYEGEAILTADLDIGDIARSRLDFDVVGHYARPDVFQLIVDETSKTPVGFRNAAAADATPMEPIQEPKL